MAWTIIDDLLYEVEVLEGTDKFCKIKSIDYYWVSRAKIENVYESKEECIKALNKKIEEKAMSLKAKIKTDKDLVRLLLEEFCNQEDVDLARKKAYEEKAKELMGVEMVYD